MLQKWYAFYVIRNAFSNVWFTTVPLRGWRPPLREILDPRLWWFTNSGKTTHYTLNEQVLILSEYEIMFSIMIKRPDDYVNTICLIIRDFIYVTRCKQEQLSLLNCMHKIVKYKKLEEIIAIRKSKLDKHMAKW